MKATILFIIFFLLNIITTTSHAFTHHERGQICAEDRKDTLDIDMNDICLSWEALYQTEKNLEGETFLNGEFLILIKPMAYGAKDLIQIYMRESTYLSGIFNLHRDDIVSGISPGDNITSSLTDLFTSPCNYNSFINTTIINSDCESNAFVISGKNSNLTHPFLISQLISFKNTSVTPNIIISSESNNAYLYDMFYNSGFPKEHIHFHDAMVGDEKTGVNSSGSTISLDNCKLTKGSSLSSDCTEALRDYFSKINDKSLLPSSAVKGNICTAEFSISKMLSFTNSVVNFNSNQKWAPISGELLSGSDIENYFSEENSNVVILDKYSDLRAKRKLGDIANIICDQESESSEGGPYVGVAWGSNFSIAGFGSALTLPQVSLTNIVEVTGTTSKGASSFFGSLAALTNSGSVITWGHQSYGGDSSSVQDDLTSNVSKVYSNNFAFAALKNNGSVITWGLASSGGSSASVSTQLSSGVIKIFATEAAFAALKEDGSVITWGFGDQANHPSNYGGDSSGVDLTSAVTKIFSTDGAFTALKSNGSIVTWGRSDYGGNAPQSVLNLTDIVDVYSANFAFAALRSNGQVVTWGHNSHGGDSGSADLSNISEVFGNKGGFAAIKNDGSVLAWGNPDRGGLIPASKVNLLSSGVDKIYHTDEAFSALKSDGSVVTWGNSDHGGDSSHVSLSNISEIYSNHFSFAAVDNTGKVITWGYGDQAGHHSNYGGDSSSVTSDLSSGVTEIASNLAAFAAIKNDGSVITWGYGPGGGDTSNLPSLISSGVKKVYSAPVSFIALKE